MVQGTKIINNKKVKKKVESKNANVKIFVQKDNVLYKSQESKKDILLKLVKLIMKKKRIKVKLVKVRKSVKIKVKKRVKIKVKKSVRVKLVKFNVKKSAVFNQIKKISRRVSTLIQQKNIRISRRKKRRTWYMIRKDIENWEIKHKNTAEVKFLKHVQNKNNEKAKEEKLRDKKLTAYSLLCRETFNNILGTLVNGYGQVLAKCNSGAAGFVGSKRNSKYAASIVGLKIGNKAKGKNIKNVIIKLKKKTTGKMLSFYRGFKNSGVALKYIHLNIRNTHESFRVKKARRV